MSDLKRICKNLYLGDDTVYNNCVEDFKNLFFYVNAAKIPYHRDIVEYKGVACPKDSPYYLFYKDDDRFVMNLIDGEDMKYVNKECMDSALKEIHKQRLLERPVLVNCNQCLSRSPTIVLLYLQSIGKFADMNFDDSVDIFIRKYYCFYSPNKGIFDYARENWDYYRKFNLD